MREITEAEIKEILAAYPYFSNDFPYSAQAFLSELTLRGFKIVKEEEMFVRKSKYDALDASLVPGLVTALKVLRNYTSVNMHQIKIIDEALSSLPPEYRNATQEKGDAAT